MKSHGIEYERALAEHDPKRRPTLGEQRAIVADYLRAEREEERIDLELRAIRAKKSALARAWLVLVGDADRVIVEGQLWVVQTTRWGGFQFRRYKAPGTQIINLENP